jgi:APA family basic amino acid/polyamine antiporter
MRQPAESPEPPDDFSEVVETPPLRAAGRGPGPRLRRTLGVPGLFSSAYGNVGSSIYYALGVTALYALGLTPLVFMVAGALFAATAVVYAEGATTFPEAGGSSSFARHAFNDFVGFVAGWALMLDYVITIAISAFSVPSYLAVIFPVLKTYPANSISAIALVAVLAAINVLGVSESAKLNVALSILDLFTEVIVAIVGLLVVFSLSTLVGNVHLGVAPTWSNLIYSISISMIAYTGIETVSNLAEEARDPGRDVPRATVLIVAAVLSLYLLISSIALSAMPVQQVDGKWTTPLGTTYLTDPIIGIIRGFPASVPPLLVMSLTVWVGVLAATILLIATNAGLLGLSRLVYSLSEHQQLPPFLGIVHPRFRTPYVAIVIFSIVAALLIAPGSLPILADLYSFGAMLAFTFAHLSILALRVKQPGLHRPYRAPLNVWVRGVAIPLTAVVGGLGTFATWLVVVLTHVEGRTVGFLWLVVGLLIYVVYRRSIGLGLTESATPPTP